MFDTELRVNNRVEETIKKVGCMKWKEAMENRETLQWYKDKNKPRWESCYDGSWEAKPPFKAKSESLEVNSRTYRWNNGGRWWCEKCSNEENPRREDVKHIMLKCEWYNEEREEWERKISHEIGIEEWIERKQREDNGMKLIMGVEEYNSNIVKGTKEYLNKIWKKRERGGEV